MSETSQHRCSQVCQQLYRFAPAASSKSVCVNPPAATSTPAQEPKREIPARRSPAARPAAMSDSPFSASQAVLMAARFCRRFPLFRWREEALPGVGRRADKHCFRADLTDLMQDRRAEVLLTLFPAQMVFLDLRKESALYRLKALLVTLKHPYVMPVLDIYFAKEKQGVLVAQPFVAAGSIKDRIHGADPTRPYDSKYAASPGSPLPLADVAKFGLQILQALAALRSKGVLCDHLSSGNVLVDGGDARIADIYLPLLAVDRRRASRELTVPLEAAVDVDLLLFGHVLYEMATGAELRTPQPDAGVLALLPPQVREVLELIFFPYDSEASPSPSSAPSGAGDGDDLLVLSVDGDKDDDDDASASSVSAGGGERRRTPSSHKYLVDIASVERCALFASAQGVPPIDSVFAGFRLDSAMKSTIKSSMRVNASRSRAHLVHYKDVVALERARQRAERRVLEEKDKQQQRAQRLAESKNSDLLARSASFSSKTTPTRRQSYRADRFRAHSQRALGLSSSGRHGNSSAA